MYKYLMCFVPVLLLMSSPSLAQRYDRIATETYTVDALLRVMGVSGRSAIPCTKQTERTAVLLLAGQSNGANSGEARYVSAHPDRVVNYFDGKCYRAASPLMGTNDTRGESWTTLADQLVEAGIFDNVILIPTNIGGTEIARWQAGGDLNEMLRDVIANAAKKCKITHVLWHQGESDLILRTTVAKYKQGFDSLVATIRKAGVSAPVFISVASKCGEIEWSVDDPVAVAQRQLVDSSKGIFAGPDTNALIPPTDRQKDRCHFAKSGQEKFAREWVFILRNFEANASH